LSIAFIKRNDLDFITHIECGDGQNDYSKSRLYTTLKAGVKDSDVVNMCVKAMSSSKQGVVDLPKDKASSEAGMPPFGPNDSFGLSRMTMWCCAADAYALGFAVNNTTSFAPQADQWVRVQGTLEVRNSKALYLKATNITPVNPPDTPFVYEKK